MNSIARVIVVCAVLTATSAFAADGPCRGQEPQGWDVSLVSEGEPGTPMVIQGVVYDAESGEPVPNVTIYAYQTDAEGYYSENRGMNNRDPRLCVILRTNEEGAYRLRTIRPADYATGGVRAHVHFVTWGDGLDRKTHLLQFESDVEKLPESGLERAETHVSGRVQTVYQDDDGVLHVRRDLRVSG